MVRPKKSAVASRSNGANAKNKGKAKVTVPMLKCGPSAAGGFVIGIEQRAKLPKGYVAYESELRANYVAITHGGQVPKTEMPEEKMTASAWRCHDVAVKEQSMQMAAEAKDLDAAKKLSKLKALTKGTEREFVFEKIAPRRPCHGSGRASSSR